MAIEAYPLQPVPVAHVAVYDTDVIGLTSKVFPVPKVTAVFEVSDHVIVPVQLVADNMIGVFAQILLLEDVIVGVIPKPPTFTAFCAVAAQVPVPQVTE
jgi:hypothetical protein